MNIRDQMEELKHPSERAIKQWGFAEDEFLARLLGHALSMQALPQMAHDKQRGKTCDGLIRG